MARWPSARDEEFAFAIDLARPVAGERVLDVPAGGGYLADRLPEGVDYLALETASSFASLCRTRGLDVVEAPLDGSTLPANSVDVVVSVAGVHHEADLAALLMAWRRLLRHGGRVVVADVALDSAVALFLDGFVGRHNVVGHEGTFLGPDLRSIAARAGYHDVDVVDADYRWRFDDEDALGRYCAALFGLSGCTVADVVEAARQGPGIESSPDGSVSLRWGLRGLVARSLAT